MALDSVLITGCSAGGLGSAIAVAFQKRGLHVFATARDVSKMKHLSGIENITLLPLDVTSPSSIAEAAELVQKSEVGGGKLKYLVNNAGSGYMIPLLDTDIEVAKKMFDTNVWGLLGVTKVFAPLVIKEAGVVVSIGSSAGVVYFPWGGIYGASKAAVNLLSETLRLELEPFNVRVITCVAGIIQSKFHDNLKGSSFSLPPDSKYKSMEGVIREQSTGTRKGALAEDVMSAEEFGRRVAKDVLGGRFFGGKTGKTYTGTLGWSMKYVVWWWPVWLFDIVCRDRGQMSKFKKV